MPRSPRSSRSSYHQSSKRSRYSSDSDDYRRKHRASDVKKHKKQSKHYRYKDKSRGRGKKSESSDYSDSSSNSSLKNAKQSKVKKEIKPIKTKEEIKKERENAKLEAEMKKRRDRIEKWRQEKKKQSQEGLADNSLEVQPDDLASKSTWTLEDDEDDVTENDAEMKGEENGEEAGKVINGESDANEESVKPVAVVMETNTIQLLEEKEEIEVDPLDAFMVGIKEEVKKIKQADRAKIISQKTVIPSPINPAILPIDQTEFDIPLQIEKPIPVIRQPIPKSVRGELMEQGEDLLEYSSEEEEMNYHEMTAMLNSNSNQSKLDKFITSMDKTYVEYEPFQKDFYKEVPEITNMTPQEVAEYRTKLEDIQVRGKNCPRPIKTWAQAGLSVRIIDILKKLNMTTPTPIQTQALPAIMSGRDVIAIAKTGSGKTLAFLLPLFRHIAHQELPGENEGPIALIMTPTRELATQIYKDARKFVSRISNLGEVVCIYGGAGISEQIASLKRSPSIVVATPGRMIDMLASNSGKVTNLKRITYCVLDEADRMFDMGFEPQVMRIIELVRPDRQTVLLSATFPRQMEALARRILKKPIEIQVGSRSVVTDTVQQNILVMENDQQKYLKLLEILGHFYGDRPPARNQTSENAANPLSITRFLKSDKTEHTVSDRNMQLAIIPGNQISQWREPSKILVFVEKQERADELLKNLITTAGYSCLALHGGLDQADRDSVISDFKAGHVKILIATSIAARGLDVKNLDVVVNFDCPNHYEDYVHRCGRTGRAGNKGFSYTFVTAQQGKMSGELIKALELAKTPVPEALIKLWESYKEERKAAGHEVKESSGGDTVSSTGFGGRGFKFDRTEERLVKDVKKQMNPEEEDESNPSQTLPANVDHALDLVFKGESSKSLLSLDPSTRQSTIAVNQAYDGDSSTPSNPKLEAAKAAASKLVLGGAGGGPDYVQRATEAFMKGKVQAEPIDYEKKRNMAELLAEKLNAKLNYLPSSSSSDGFLLPSLFNNQGDNVGLQITGSSLDQNANIPHLSKYEEEIEINDLPQQCRWKITSRDTVNYISEFADVGITVKGQYVHPTTNVSKKRQEIQR
ncbi:probable ATP-dependent RNA helicase DDX46 isoform X2 [Gordionus sp. m RMFG-2023]|uniref:probable ATP-dependent RNA helicase DDX46 isoform X2 n=1 Tax=Gordionus sp. m RMFG-2023 TaxID=3053472 RepID=UPI0031FE0C20